MPLSRGKDGKRNRYYVCRFVIATPKELELYQHRKCSLPIIPAEMLEDWALARLKSKLGVNPEVTQQCKRSVNPIL